MQNACLIQSTQKVLAAGSQTAGNQEGFYEKGSETARLLFILAASKLQGGGEAGAGGLPGQGQPGSADLVLTTRACG